MRKAVVTGMIRWMRLYLRRVGMAIENMSAVFETYFLALRDSDSKNSNYSLNN